MVFVIAVAAILLPVLLGIGVAAAFARFDRVVVETKEEVKKVDTGYNPALTLGHEIKTTASPAQQLREARKIAATRAAATPRGANMRIGHLGQSNLQTAWKGVDHDPITAVKIALYHGWQGVKTGAVPVQETAAAPAAQQAGAQSGKIEVVAGRDYEQIKITDDMSGAEKRKARIANAKAKAAAYKAAKAAPQSGAAPAAAPAQQQAAPAAAPAQSAADTAAAAGVEPPKLIEITDDMSPDEVRKARIANAKANSAYNKALKAAGIDPSAADEGAAPAQPAPAAEPAAPAAPAANGGADSAALANIPKPDLVEITDDMSPDEVRKARISNAKAKSAYNKALKEAGIDPKTVDI